MEPDTTETRIFGYTLRGLPVYLFSGAETDDDGGDGGADDEGADEDENDDGSADDAEKGDEDEKLKDAGKRALDRERERRKNATKALAPWKSLETEFGTPEDIRAKLASKTTEDVEKVRREGVERAATMQKTIAALAVRALATEFLDPDDAAKNINLSSIEVGEHGEVDEDEIQDELNAILEKKPHLRKTAAQDTKKRKLPAPDKSQGGGKNAGGKNSSATLEAGADRMKRLMGKGS